MQPFNVKPRPCTHCGSAFVPARPLQRVCSPVCAARKVKADKAEERAKIRTRKEAIKTIPVLIAEAQKAFNAFIRERDRDKPCICCGVSLGFGDVGGAYDAGHYRSTGSASHLRFNEANCHAQRKYCNRYGAGRAVDYRIGLIARIGLHAVEHLESSNDPNKWTREELVAIKAMYVRRLKDMKKSPIPTTKEMTP